MLQSPDVASGPLAPEHGEQSRSSESGPKVATQGILEAKLGKARSSEKVMWHGKAPWWLIAGGSPQVTNTHSRASLTTHTPALEREGSWQSYGNLCLVPVLDYVITFPLWSREEDSFIQFMFHTMVLSTGHYLSISYNIRHSYFYKWLLNFCIIAEVKMLSIT